MPTIRRSSVEHLMLDESNTNPMNEGLTGLRQWAPSCTLTCDQVAWLLAAIRRYLPRDDFPGVSQQYEMRVHGLLYEIMDLANLGFMDTDAANNGTPSFLLKLRGTRHDG